MALWVATRREGHGNGAPRCCVSSQGPGLGVVTRLDGCRFHGLRTGKKIGTMTWDEKGEQRYGAVGVYELRGGNWELRMRSDRW